MDVQEEPQLKRSRTLDPHHCIICADVLDGSSKGPPVNNPTQEGLQSVLQAAKLRQDDVYHQIGIHSEEILSFELKVFYHKSCRAKYTSKTNLRYQAENPETMTEGASLSECASSYHAQPRRLSRCDTSNFNIREQCFICGTAEKRLPNKSREKLTPISTDTGQSTRTKVLEASEMRHDGVMHLRMLSYPDLFAFDAKYHRSCYSRYIAERNVKAAMPRQVQDPSIYDKAFYELAEEIKQTVLSKRIQRVGTLSEERVKYVKLLTEMGIPTTQAQCYSSWKLKQRLKNHFQGRLSFIEREGFSDIMCSSCVTVGDVLLKAKQLEEQLMEQDDIQDVSFLSDPANIPLDTDETLILHRAAGILRKNIQHITDSSDSYMGTSELEVDHCKDFVPDCLYNFIRWTTNDDDYHNVKSSGDDPSTKADIRVVSICHDLIALGQNVQTPLTLGIGLHVHHNTGSKQLIDVLHNLGHSVSYDEVRRFLTSVAKYQISQAAQVYVPQGIQRVDIEDTNTFIDAAIDNFDQNEETLDGKTTTHSMATVLYQRCTVQDANDTCIPRIKQKTLDVTEYVEEPIHRYCQPHSKPEPPSVQNTAVLDVNSEVISTAKTKDLVWELSRLASRGTTTIPAWSGFNYVTSVSSVPLATIRYLPFIHAPPTDLSTIYTTLLKLVAVAHKQGQPHILVTADLAIYCKAQQILWNKPALLAGRVTMRLGGMHHLMAFIASIGKLFGDGGLLDLLTVTDVYADATARAMLQGKQLNRAVRGIKLVAEALSYLFISSAKSWAEKQGLPWMSTTTEQGLKDLQHTFRAKDYSSSTDIIDNLDTSRAQEAMKQFQSAGIVQSATFAFWNNFLEASHVMLRLLRAERDADFDLHLSAMSESIPYFIVGGRNNYAKYTPVYVAEMKQLETEQPAAYKHLQSGGFVVRQIAKHKFNCVSTDQALEQTVNRDAKSEGGVIGFTLRKGALLRWLLTRHVTASYSEAMRLMCINPVAESHQELGKSRLSRDASDVEKIFSTLVSQYHNPFDIETVPRSLINIVTGQVASAEVEKCLVAIKETGRSQMKTFVEKRLLQDSRSMSFWDPQQRTKLKTFADMRKPLQSDKQRRLVCSSEVLFRRLLSVSNMRHIDMKVVLQYELAPVPPALFNDDGSIRKVNKSELAKKLESVCDEVHNLTPVSNPAGSTAYIIDGMAMVQSLNDSLFKTFDDMAELILKKILKLLELIDLDVVTLVFDRYDRDDSIKRQERQRRGARDNIPSHLIAGSRDVPNYRLFLKSSANKAALAAFVCEYIASKAPSNLQQGKSIVLAGGFADGQIVKLVSYSGVVLIEHLFSTQEEADTRIVLHAIDLSNTHSRVIVRCDDTDVLVILLYYCSEGLLADEIYMHAGHSGKVVTRERYIPVHTIAGELGLQVCQCLPAVHSLTGCDTTSGIFKIGKRTAFTKLLENITSVHRLSEFGVSSSLPSAICHARTFVLLLYGKSSRNCSTLDELRYILASSTNKTGAMLPPTEDAFEQHVMRAVFQASIWCRSHIPQPTLKDPIGHGWAIGQDGMMEPKCCEKACAPVQLRDVTHLYCNDESCNLSQKCPCLLAGLPCIESCSCVSCPNSSIAAPLVASEDDDSDAED